MLSVFTHAIRVRENLGGVSMKNALIVPAVALVLGVASCTNPYDPGQRALGGAAIGAGTGAAIGAAAGGGTGAAIGAATGGALGAITGAATTPPPPQYPPPGYPPPGIGHSSLLLSRRTMMTPIGSCATCRAGRSWNGPLRLCRASRHGLRWNVSL